MNSSTDRRLRLIESLESRLLLTVWNPATASAFSSALTSSQLGDTIVLNAGTNYVGSFTLPNKTSGSGWITIQSSALDKLPAAGVRVTPKDAINMPKIISQGGNAEMIKTVAGAHHFQFVGIEFIAPLDNSALVTGIQFGDYSSAQDTVAEVPHHLNIDRSYIHGNSLTQLFRRAVALHSDYSDITNSWISEVHDQGGSDAQAIAGWNGIGHYNIINNHLEGSAENIMFGGTTMSIPNVVPSDILIQRNHIIKPLSLKGVWPVKNLFEIKTARRVTLDGNIFENCWVSAQTGPAIVLKTNKDSTWASTDDITITNNVIRNAAGGFQLQGLDYVNNFGHLWNVTIRNNFFENVGNSFWGSNGRLFQVTNGPKNITIDHNTAFHTGTPVAVDTNVSNGFVFTNNLMAHNAYGIKGDGQGIGNTTITAVFGDSTITKNVLMGGSASNYTVRPGNYFPSSWSAVGFVDQSNGNYRLTSSSTYHNAATDGTDVGANINTIESAVAGVANGIFDGVSGAADSFTVRRFATSGTRLEVNNPAWVAGSLPAIPFVDNFLYYQELQFNTADGDDSVSLDYSGGSPVPDGTTGTGIIKRGISFDGGAGTDTLAITGNGGSATYTPDAATAGKGQIAAGGNISFTTAEAISGSGLASFTLVTPNAADTLTIDSPESGKFRVSGNSGGIGIAPATLTANIPLTIDEAANDGAGGNDSITVAAGTNPITSLSINAGTGTNTLTANGGNFSLNTNLGIGGVNLDVAVNNSGTAVSLPGSQNLRSLTLASGGDALLPTNGSSVLRATSLAVSGAGSQLNLRDNDLIIDYAAASPIGSWNGSNYSGITGYIRAGRNGGSWNGDGIIASAASATTLGIAEAADVKNISGTQTAQWGGQTVDATCVLVKFTWSGDANLSGAIDGDDYFRIDSAWGGALRAFAKGEFNYDGRLDADDYWLIDSNYVDSQIAPLGAVAAPAATGASDLPTVQWSQESIEKSLLDELI